MRTAPLHVVAMGVSATGKSVIGSRLAAALGFEFIEGDDFHPKTNIDKMAAGTALTDEDRLPWLQTLADLLGQRDRDGTSTVLTCSALKRGYRDILRSGAPDVFFVHLHAPFDVLLDRMTRRTKHFMPNSLLESQFETLEPLAPDEYGVEVDVTPPIDAVLTQALRDVREQGDL